MAVIVVVSAEKAVFTASEWTIGWNGGRIEVVVVPGMMVKGPKWVFVCPGELGFVGFRQELEERMKLEGFCPVGCKFDGAFYLGGASQVVVPKLGLAR